MPQNYNNADKNESGSQALVKSDNNSHALTLKGKGSLLALTDSILSSAIASRKANQLAVDDSWMQEIWDWADSFRLSEEQVPRNKNSLKALKDLDVGGMNISKLPESIGKLLQLTSINLHYNNLKTLPESIGQLINLTELAVGSNDLQELPESIGKLVNLTTVWFLENRLN